MSNGKRLGEVIDFSAFTSNMSDEEWAEHDRRVAAARAAAQTADQQHALRERRQLYRDAGFPLRAIEAAECANTNAPAIVNAKSWMESDRSILVLSGAPGCGKTVAATWWALQRTWPPQFLRAATFAAGSRYDQAQRDAWSKPTALVLDDLGAEYLDNKGSFLVDLDEMIDTYYADRRPLVITTNCTKETFVERYGERVTDRLRECARWMSVASGSMRSRRTP